MAVKQYKEYKRINPKKKRINKKKQRRRNKIKQAFHNIFAFIMVLFAIPFVYFLFWGLIIEPNLPRHIYGPGDLKEFIYLMFSLLIIAVSYFIILLINYKPLNMQWWDDLKLLASVRFSLEKFTAMKRMGIKYNKHKRKNQYRHYHDEEAQHKSITQ